MFELISTAISGSIGSYASNYAQSPGEPREVIMERLDPVSYLAMVAMMRYRPLDTKFHIGDHSVSTSHSRDYTYFGVNLRGLSRLNSEDSREDLDLIRTCTKKAAQWHEPHLKQNTEIRSFLYHVIRGIQQIRGTYSERSPMSRSGLKYHILKIRKYFERPTFKPIPHNAVTIKVKELWDKEQIGEINRLLEAMKKKQGDTPVSTKVLCEPEIAALEKLLEAKFAEAKKIYT